MKRSSFSPIIVSSIVSVLFAASMAHAQGLTLFKGKFVPCRPSICGEFPQNQAALRLSSSDVEVTDDGSVRLTLVELRVIETGEIAANSPFVVYFGSFVPYDYYVEGLGNIVTDSEGNFDGPIDAGGGVPFVFRPGATVAGNFILNSGTPQYQIRSEFLSGIAIP